MEFSVSPQARAVLHKAAILSMQRGKYQIRVEYLLDALIDSAQMLPTAFADRHVPSLRRVMERMHAYEFTAAPPVLDVNDVYYSARALEVIRDATAVARRFRRGQSAPAHLLIAILAQESSETCRLIDSEGLSRTQMISDLRDDILRSSSVLIGADSKPATTRVDGSGLPALEAISLISDLTDAARKGHLSRPFGREKETAEIVDILAQQQRNNVLLVGNRGVGKTKLVEGLAVDLATGDLKAKLGDARVIDLNLTSLLTPSVQRLEADLIALVRQAEARGNVILFIDDIHLLLGTVGAASANLLPFLKLAFGNGKLRCIGATSQVEYDELLSKDPAFRRDFGVVRIGGLPPADSHKLLSWMKEGLERHHGVRIGSGTLSAAVALTDRYLPSRELPEKAIDVLEQACARFRLKMLLAESNPDALKATVDPRVAGKVTPYDVKRIVCAIASMSLDEMNEQERVKLVQLESLLNQRIVGQPAAVAKLAGAVTNPRSAETSPEQPCAALLLVGPPGVGKTQLAKDLANLAFGSSDLLITIDLSEYCDAHSASRLLGIPPGQPGHHVDGLLTVHMLNTPYCVLLFDGLEKAHPSVLDVLQPILEKGKVRDAKGREVSFTRAVVLVTTGIGSETLDRAQNEDTNLSGVRAVLAKRFPAEFLSQMNAIVPFYPLRPEDVRAILRRKIDDVRRRLAERKIKLRMFESAYSYLAQKGFEPASGARNLPAAIERYISAPLDELLNQKRFSSGETIDIRLDGDRLAYVKGEDEVPAAQPEVSTPRPPSSMTIQRGG